jgi:hypothetical protein
MGEMVTSKGHYIVGHFNDGDPDGLCCIVTPAQTFIGQVNCKQFLEGITISSTVIYRGTFTAGVPR